MSKERAKNRAAREREAGIKAAAKGSEQERREREQARKAAAASAKKPPKKAAPRTPASKKRKNAPVGRPDGPLARRRRLKVRILLALLVLVNVVAGAVWRDWQISLGVLIMSVITAPLLAALLLRRK